MKDHQNLGMQLIILLNEVKDKLTCDIIKNVREFTENQEWGLAYETLCTQLYEYDVHISYEFYTKISSLGELMGIEPKIWLPLKKIIK